MDSRERQRQPRCFVSGRIAERVERAAPDDREVGGGAGVDYRLEGKSDDLAKHAGKRVEVRGTIARQGTVAANPSAAVGTTGSNPMPLVHVKDVHTASGDCAK